MYYLLVLKSDYIISYFVIEVNDVLTLFDSNDWVP